MSWPGGVGLLPDSENLLFLDLDAQLALTRVFVAGQRIRLHGGRDRNA